MIDINCKTEDCINFVSCDNEDTISVKCGYCCATNGVSVEENTCC